MARLFDLENRAKTGFKVAEMKKLTILVGTLGSGLGALAGIIEMSIGTKILPWIGNKESPAILGAITFFLSVIALLSVFASSRNDKSTRNREAVIFLGVLLPAMICFTTVGRLWYLPGLILIITSCLLGYEYWFVPTKFGAYKDASRKFMANQIFGVIGSLVILSSVTLAFFNSSFGLYKSEMLVVSKHFHFEVLPMDIARLTDLSGGSPNEVSKRDTIIGNRLASIFCWNEFSITI